jgi:drug/metabolite transporter (DMT)-like permease
MPTFYLSFGIAVLASVLYHIFQKATPQGVNPAIGLIVTYLVALVLSFFLLGLFPLEKSVWDEFRKVNWASLALGVGIVGLEVGFLLAYRSGWNLSIAAVAANVAAALLLLPTGILLFRERPSWINIAGVFVCIAGLVMVSARR